jgi:hypothetical protein
LYLQFVPGERLEKKVRSGTSSPWVLIFKFWLPTEEMG